MKNTDIDLITLALALVVALFLFACQPPASSPDAMSGEGGAQQAPNPMAQWIPRVVAIEGTCDASLFLEVGGLPVRLKADAAAGHDHVGGEVGASVAVESALLTYTCSYERGHKKGCETGPGVPVVLPEPPPEPEEDDASGDSHEGDAQSPETDAPEEG